MKFLKNEKENKKNYNTMLVNSSDKDKNTKKKIIIIILIFLCLIIAITFYFCMRNPDEKKYNDTIAKADTYLEQKDYKQAEDYYLKAIEIYDKKADPYVKLAEVYATQNQKDKAEDILVQAKKKIIFLPEKEKIKKKEDEVSKVNTYSWLIEPTIEAKEIFYRNAVMDFPDAMNNKAKPFMSSYAIILNNGSVGLINNNQIIPDGITFKGISISFDHYCGNKMINNEYTNFSFDGNKWIEEPQNYKAVYNNLYYYYNNELHSSYEIDKDYFKRHELMDLDKNIAFPLQKTDTPFKGGVSTPTLFSKSNYAIYYKDKLVTDFIYEECGPTSDGLLAAKKDGKWGYVNQEGKTIIPFAYDSSWNHYIDLPDRYLVPFAYPASGGYINLVSDGKWELRDTTGKLIISQNEFENITPVYDNTCWVKKNGKWGLISLSEKIEKEENPVISDEQIAQKEEVTNETYEKIYIPLIQKVKNDYSDLNNYFFYDIDKDNIKELILQTGTCEADYNYEIYTIKNNEKIFLGQEPAFHSFLYESDNGGKDPYIIRASGHNRYEEIYTLSIKDGKLVSKEKSSRQLEENDNYYSKNAIVLPNAKVTDTSLIKQQE